MCNNKPVGKLSMASGKISKETIINARSPVLDLVYSEENSLGA